MTDQTSTAIPENPDEAVIEPPRKAPDGCTCIWSHTVNESGQTTYGCVHISMGRECPAYPHPRTFRP